MAEGRKILIAEDAKGISEYLVKAFERIGFDVATAIDGIEALKKIRKNKPDVILLDILMPKKSGIEVLKDIKADADLRAIPVVILSCRDSSHQIREALEAGAAEYITKPEFTEDIVSKVNRVLEES